MKKLADTEIMRIIVNITGPYSSMYGPCNLSRRPPTRHQTNTFVMIVVKINAKLRSIRLMECVLKH